MTVETKIHSVSVRLDEDLYREIDAARMGDEMADTIRALLRRALAMETVALPKSTQTKLREEKSRLENAMIEAKLAITRKEWIAVDAVRGMLRKGFALFRSNAQQIAQSVEGLTEDQRRDVAKSVEDVLEQIRAIEPEGWEHGPISDG